MHLEVSYKLILTFVFSPARLSQEPWRSLKHTAASLMRNQAMTGKKRNSAPVDSGYGSCHKKHPRRKKIASRKKHQTMKENCGHLSCLLSLLMFDAGYNQCGCRIFAVLFCGSVREEVEPVSVCVFARETRDVFVLMPKVMYVRLTSGCQKMKECYRK